MKQARLQRMKEEREAIMDENCPLLNVYPYPTLKQLSTWGIHQSQCLCAEVTREEVSGNTNWLVQQQGAAWAAHMRSGHQFSSEMFAPLWQIEDRMHPADFHYTSKGDEWKELRLNKTEWAAFNAAADTGAPPPLRWFLFKPVLTRGLPDGRP